MRPFAATLVCLALGCGAAPMRATEASVTATTWSPAVQARIDALLQRYGRESDGYDPSRPPVAVFDWDNTTMRGDVGDLAFAVMLDEERLRRPDDFRTWGPLTPPAIALLGATCPPTPGAPLPTREGPCRDAIARLALGETLPDGSPAFEPMRNAQYRASYAMLARLFAGASEADAQGLGEAVLARGLAAPVGTRLTMGGQTIDGALRVHEPMRALADQLRAAGIEVFVVSASFEPIVRAVAGHYGFAPDHVIGTRLALVDGLFQAAHPFEREVGLLIPFDAGKRFWIQHAIFGVPVGEALASTVRRPVLVAGDSDTDRTMLMDAEALAILFDRSAPLVTCLARAEPERFVIVPQFVDPLPPRDVTCP